MREASRRDSNSRGAEPGLEKATGERPRPRRTSGTRRTVRSPLPAAPPAAIDCPGEWVQEEPSIPGACARVESGALDSVVAWKGAGGRSDV